MWICDVRFDTPEAEDNFAIALAGEIFGGVRDSVSVIPKPRFEAPGNPAGARQFSGARNSEYCACRSVA